MCGERNHQGLVLDTSVTRRTILLNLGAAAVAGQLSVEAFADPNAVRVIEKDVFVRTADGSADCALFYPASRERFPAVLMWPDILGLRPVFREMGKRLAAQGYVVLVPNPYYRVKKAPVIQGRFDFSSKEDMNRIMAFRQGLSDEMADRDSKSFIDFLDHQQRTDLHRPAAVQGYCMSGPLAFRTAAVRADRIGAVATCHPGALVTGKPSSPHLLVPRTRASFLVLIARNDDAQMPDEKTVLKSSFAAARRPAKVEVYPADHGWCVAGSATYNEQQAERAWAEVLSFYRLNLG